MQTHQLLVAAVLATAIGAPMAGVVGDRHGQSRTSTGVRVPFLHGLPTGQMASPTELAALERANAWLNSPPLTPSALRGKVVLLDFWTYTCINWQRTLPYVRAWAEKYQDQGLVVIGVHAPEFAFEKHLLPATIPPEVAAALADGGPAPAGLSEQERAVFDSLTTYAKKGSSAYNVMMTARPQAVGYGLTDSPAGLAAWLLVHTGFAQWMYGGDPQQSPTTDEVLDDITLYWLTNSATSAARLYWENAGRGVTSAAAQKTADISLPVAITVFPDEVYRAPETWARRAYRNLIYFHEVDRGGHFAAWEEPQLFSEELRAAFRSLR